jgi:hypothetical protein
MLIPACALILGCVPQGDDKPAPTQTLQDSLVKLGIERAVAELFATVEPEFLRYNRITFYGTTLASTQPAKDRVEAEVKLCSERRAAGKLAAATRSDALLCFNLLLHRPDVGREYLESLVRAAKPGADRFVDAAITEGCNASEVWGEQFAVKGLKNSDVAWRRYWANWLAGEATAPETAATVRDALATETDTDVRAALYNALALLLDRKAVDAIKKALPGEKDATVQAAMVFAVAEIEGRDALAWLGSLDLKAGEVKKQIEDSTEYLRNETTDANKHGFEIGNDDEFVQRFGDLNTPSITWLAKQGLLEPTAGAGNAKLSKETKAQLFDALDQSLGFGLEAVKGSLFASLEPSDLPRLCRLRALGSYCPNGMAKQRRRTLLIMMRSLRA